MKNATFFSVIILLASSFSGCLEAINRDADDDSIKDNSDNCPHVWNPGQENTDGDLWGDVCDEDIDNDGYLRERQFILHSPCMPTPVFHSHFSYGNRSLQF